MSKEIGFLIMLNGISGLGSKRMSHLMECFGSAEAVFRSSSNALHSVGGIPRNIIEAITTAHASGDPLREFDAVKKLGLAVLIKGNPNYPELLSPLDDSPYLLYVKGNTEILNSHDAVAMVGSRECSAAGRMLASSLARDLSGSGLVVVSGLARGIDTYSHQGALSGGGYTVAVVGTGLDSVYPPENVILADRICGKGSMVSQFNLGAKPLSGNFPARNKVISGLSHGVILVEAALRSGALITADCALNHGREVMAIPGSPLNSLAAGPNKLIKQGAYLVESAEDVISAIAPRLVFSASKRGTLNLFPNSDAGTGDPILKALSNGPLGIDDICGIASLSPSEVISGLTAYRIQGRVTEHPGNIYSLTIL